MVYDLWDSSIYVARIFISCNHLIIPIPYLRKVSSYVGLVVCETKYYACLWSIGPGGPIKQPCGVQFTSNTTELPHQSLHSPTALSTNWTQIQPQFNKSSAFTWVMIQCSQPYNILQNYLYWVKKWLHLEHFNEFP